MAKFMKKAAIRPKDYMTNIEQYANGVNYSLECEDCGCVIFDTDIYDLCAK